MPLKSPSIYFKVRTVSQWLNLLQTYQMHLIWLHRLSLLLFCVGIIISTRLMHVYLFSVLNLVAIVQIWVLSFPMVLVGTGLSAVAAYYCLPYEEQSDYYGWYGWLALGAILASTGTLVDHTQQFLFCFLLLFPTSIWHLTPTRYFSTSSYFFPFFLFSYYNTRSDCGSKCSENGRCVTTIGDAYLWWIIVKRW